MCLRTVFCLQIETAYDILFMQSMKKRLAGEGVAAKIRYADVAKRKPAKQVCYLSLWPASLNTLVRTSFICLMRGGRTPNLEWMVAYV